MRSYVAFLAFALACILSGEVGATSTWRGTSYLALKRIDYALLHFSAKMGHIPRDQSEFEEAVRNNPEIFSTLGLKDAWGNEVIYRHPGRDGRLYDLYSAGANGIDENGASDDVAVWEYRGHYVSEAWSWDSLAWILLVLDGPIILIVALAIFIRKKWIEA